jgi:hypothetical protein
LTSAGKCELQIIDVKGNVVRKLFSGNQTSGEHQLTINLNDSDMLSNGVFFLRLITDKQAEQQKFIIK